MISTQARFERRLRWLAFGVGVPGSLVALILLWADEHDDKVRLTLVIVIAVGWLITGASLVHRVVFPLQTLANLLGGLREGDFSTRARGAVRDDALGEVLIEANVT